MVRGWRCGWLLITILFMPGPVLAGDPQALIDRGSLTLQEMRQDKAFNAADKLRRAKAILIVPALTKGGLLLGGQGGDAILMVKQPSTGWSEPAFYSVGGGTVGLQIGFHTAQMVLLVMSDPVLQTWLRGDFKLGTQDGVAVFAQGTQYSDKTSQGSDVIAWVRATGAYAGITIEGTSISFNRDENRAYYGKSLSPVDIVIDGLAKGRGTEQLRAAVSVR